MVVIFVCFYLAGDLSSEDFTTCYVSLSALFCLMAPSFLCLGFCHFSVSSASVKGRRFSVLLLLYMITDAIVSVFTSAPGTCYMLYFNFKWFNNSTAFDTWSDMVEGFLLQLHIREVKFLKNLFVPIPSLY